MLMFRFLTHRLKRHPLGWQKSAHRVMFVLNHCQSDWGRRAGQREGARELVREGKKKGRMKLSGAGQDVTICT